MIHNPNMPNVQKVLEFLDSDIQAHLLVAGLPGIIAAGIRVWCSESEPENLERRVEAAFDAAAEKLRSHLQ